MKTSLQQAIEQIEGWQTARMSDEEFITLNNVVAALEASLPAERTQTEQAYIDGMRHTNDSAGEYFDKKYKQE